MAKITNLHDFSLFIKELAHDGSLPGHLAPGESAEVSDEVADDLHQKGIVAVEGKNNDHFKQNLSAEEKAVLDDDSKLEPHVVAPRIGA